MKAAIYTHYGPPEIVKVMEVEKPSPKDKEVLIKVFRSTVNRTDCGFRSAEYFISRFFTGLFRPRNAILGCEFAGKIEAIGPSANLFKVGDRVFGFDDKKLGGHGEYMVLDETKSMSTIPVGISFDIAAAILEGAHYALCDIRAAKVKAGQKVLVNGGTGAIGSAAVQLLKHFGAHVTAVCDTKNITLLKELGADVVIDYLKKDFTQTGEKYDFIFDAVGKSAFGKCKPILVENGIYISTELGKNSENIFLALFKPILGRKKVLFPLPTINKADVEFIKDLVEKKKFIPIIDRNYKLDDIVEAYKFVETGQKTGNVIVEICEQPDL